MMFDDRFATCTTLDDAEQLYVDLLLRTPLESRMFLMRAFNKVCDVLPTVKELAERAKRERKFKERFRNGDRETWNAHDNVSAGYSNRIHTLIAEAVADDTNVTLPRRWLAKHSEAIAGAYGCGVTHIPKEYHVLYNDLREMVQEANDRIPSFKADIGGDPVYIHKIIR